jgi:hypothetical protein
VSAAVMDKIYESFKFFIVSQDPGNYEDAPTEGIRRVLEIVTGNKIPRRSVLETEKIGVLYSIELLPENIQVFISH